MSDIFYEHLIKRKKKSGEQVIKIIMILLTALLIAAGLLLSPFVMIAGLVMAGLDYYFIPMFDVEYEYQYVNGEIDVDAIYGRQRRKRLGTIGRDGIECIAPLGSRNLDSYQMGYRVVDYSSLDPDDKPYVIVKGDERVKYYLNLSEDMINDLRFRMPRIVSRD